MDKETFELCRKLNLCIPEWGIVLGAAHFDKDGNVFMRSYHDGVGFLPERGDIPFYTIEYLLSHMPMYVTVDNNEFWLKITPFTENSWSAIYGNSQSMRYHKNSDTPLKALLGLAIKLAEAGEIK